MRVIVFFLLMSQASVSFAQFGYYRFGAKSEGLAHADVAYSHSGSLFGNIAGIATISDNQVLIGYQRFEQVAGFDRYAVGYIDKTNWSTLGFTLYGFGDDLSSERKISAGVAHRIGMFSVGVKAHFSQIAVEGFDSRYFWMIDIGGMAYINKQLQFGLYIGNLNQSEVAEYPEAHFPLSLDVGFKYSPSDQVNLLFEIQQSSLSDMQAGLAIEYMPVLHWAFRGGYQAESSALSAGVGFGKKYFQIDYAFSYLSYPGISHQIGLSLTVASHE